VKTVSHKVGTHSLA